LGAVTIKEPVYNIICIVLRLEPWFPVDEQPAWGRLIAQNFWYCTVPSIAYPPLREMNGLLEKWLESE
jgi:hypothetical protein